MKCKCLECGKYSTVEEWNKKTQEEYGEKIYKLEQQQEESEYYYICPKCGAEHYGDMLKMEEGSA